MAIDTAEKRRSAASVMYAGSVPGVTPNASKDAEWRQQAAWSYSGIATTVVATLSAPSRLVATMPGRTNIATHTNRITQADMPTRNNTLTLSASQTTATHPTRTNVSTCHD